MQEPVMIEHVILFNMTTYECIYIVLIVVQTIFLIKYARETVKMRRTADAQLDILKTQTETMRTQNETLTKQLAASIDEIERNRKYEIAKITPLFEFSTTFTTGSKRGVRIEDVKNMIRWNEIRATVQWQNSSTGTPMICGRTIEIAEHFEDICIGIRYCRLVDNEEMSVVYSFATKKGKYEPEPTMDFYKLLSAQ